MFEVQKVTRGLNVDNISICGFGNKTENGSCSLVDIHQL